MLLYFYMWKLRGIQSWGLRTVMWATYLNTYITAFGSATTAVTMYIWLHSQPKILHFLPRKIIQIKNTVVFTCVFLWFAGEQMTNSGKLNFIICTSTFPLLPLNYINIYKRLQHSWHQLWKCPQLQYITLNMQISMQLS